MSKKDSRVNSSPAGKIFDIKKYAIHDGPGIRTTVFLKGCPLSCRWCSNPESQAHKPQLAYNRNKCISISECVRCAEVCTVGALSRGDDDKVTVEWDSCTNCLACADVCPAGALIVYGEQMTAKNVIDQVEKDASFYARSGGGLTLGGGEPLAQKAFALALLREAKRRYIKTAVETCGYVGEEVLLEACKFINFLMYDIKCVDSELHKKFTDVDNAIILKNIKAVREMYPKLPIRVRTPVIPGFNDTTQEIEAIAAFIKELNVEFELLPYHRLGTQKYTNMGLEYPMGEVALENEKYLRLRQAAIDAGAEVK